jgi:hopanoid biosynthesis associated radical SAM protein HpnH
MGVPISQMATVATYILRQKLARRPRYPLVLMLEPLYRCNLSCAGCGKIQYPSNVLKSQLSVEDCLRAVDECGAPIVSIPGGEPLLHPEIDRLVAGLVARKKYIYLCSNALLLEEKLDLFEPSKYLSFSIHLDGLEPEHDASVCRPGTYRKALRAVELALSRGFRVTTNTTLFHGADPERTADFFDAMMKVGVEGMMVSPGYSYAAAPDQEHFLAREATRELFRRIFRLGAERRARWRFNQSPLFLEFLTGAREHACTAWGMPSYGVFGWQKPCYLLQEGYSKSFDELITDTAWDRYGPESGNPACRDCMVHSGFEATAVDEGFSSWRGFLDMARAALFGPRVPAPTGAATIAASQPVGEDEGGGAPGVELDATPESLRAAFQYRGDVTLWLDDGSPLEGFVADAKSDELTIWPRGQQHAQRLPSARVRRVVFSGRDLTERGRALAERGRERAELRTAAGSGSSAA